MLLTIYHSSDQIKKAEILEKWDGKGGGAWTGLIWLRIGTSGGGLL